MNILTVAGVLAAAAVSSSTVIKSPDNTIPPNFELLILHNNDMHARFEQTSQLSGACTTLDREAGKCYGGFPRVAHVVKEARRKAATGEGPPVLYLNAGDTYTGTAWFTIYKWKIAAEFINALRPDAVSLGNHEFDEAVEGLVPFVRNISSPVVAANLILDKVPELMEEKNLHESVILIKNGTKIGVIGYLTPETKTLSSKTLVEYEDEIPAIKREVKKLKKQGVHILIALGHSGYVKDLEIAKNVKDLDLVIGGHSNTFMWNGDNHEKPESRSGPYPTVVKHPDGTEVLVVQAYAYTKYIGRLHLTFNPKGEVVKYDGNPTLLDKSIPKDPETLAIVNFYRSDIDRISKEVVGTSSTTLDGLSCRLKECNMGNIITDILVNYTKTYYNEQHPDANIAICQSGRIRASIDKIEIPFKLTKGDWLSVLPFSDSLAVVTMNGSILLQALEHSVDAWRPVDSLGQFLQFSGMEVVFDLSKAPGNRIIKAKAVCSGCGYPGLSKINDKFQYKLIMPSFLSEGGDGFRVFEGLPMEPLPYNELTCVYDYLNEYGTINPKLTGRIQLLNKDKAIKAFEEKLKSISSSLPTSGGVTIQSNTKVIGWILFVCFLFYFRSR